MLLNVTRVLNLTELRQVEIAEIQSGGEHWSNELKKRFQRSQNSHAETIFRRTARNFLRYHHALAIVAHPPPPFGDVLSQYQSFLAEIRSPATVQSYVRWIRQFLSSIEGIHSTLSSVAATASSGTSTESELGSQAPHHS